MGRGKIQIRKIENSTSRQVTFSKRRAGLIKKAHELSVLCDAEVAVVIFSSTGKMFEFASSSITRILERYFKITSQRKLDDLATQDEEVLRREVRQLKQQLESLQATHRNLTGEDLSSLNGMELFHLERQLEIGLNRVKAKKDQMLMSQIQDLDRKEQLLQEENKSLRRKITELEINGVAAKTMDKKNTVRLSLDKSDAVDLSKALSQSLAVQLSHSNDHCREIGNSKTALQLGMYETYPQLSERLDRLPALEYTKVPRNEDESDQAHDWIRWT